MDGGIRPGLDESSSLSISNVRLVANRHIPDVGANQGASHPFFMSGDVAWVQSYGEGNNNLGRSRHCRDSQAKEQFSNNFSHLPPFLSKKYSPLYVCLYGPSSKAICPITYKGLNGTSA